MICSRFKHLWFPFWWKRNRFCLFCGTAEELKIGKNTITLGPSGKDVIKITSVETPGPGEIAMAVTGRPTCYAESGVRSTAHTDEIIRQKDIVLCSDLRATDEIVFYNLAVKRIDSADLPGITPTIKFTALLSATAGKTAECQLYNLTDGSIVAGSVLTSSSLTPDYQEASVSLASGIKDYAAQLRMTTASGGTDQVTASSIILYVTW